MLREAVSADFRRIMELYAQLHPDDSGPTDGSDRRVFHDILAASNLHLFVLADEEGTVNATCYLNLIPNITHQASPYGIIENVVSEVSLRNQGLGKKVIDHALRYAWDFGCYKVMLQTGSKSESTHNFYKACGFSANDKFAFVARP